ncbi:phosphoribosyl-ATP diphosphatase [Candidatus Pyrohabitans sp.]
MSCDILQEVFEIIRQRKESMPRGSYVASLFEKGEDKILEKIGEEAVEVILASKSGGREELIYESADLVFHLMVLLAAKGVELEEVYEELRRRRR